MGDITPAHALNVRRRRRCLAPSKLSTTILTHNWFFKPSDDLDVFADWLPVNSVPSTVHQDLMDNGRLRDPFIGYNELTAEWVGEQAWTYRTDFIIRDEILERLVGVNTFNDCDQNGDDDDDDDDNDDIDSRCKMRAVLAFDGLDTFATIKIDDYEVLKTDNMFLPYRVDITDLISSLARQAPGYNFFELSIEFESALMRGKQIRQQYPDHKWICSNGDSSRLAVRKAQYHWGWDWGPYLMAAGIWREVRLEIFETRISDVKVEVRLSDDLKEAYVILDVEVEGWNAENCDINYHNYDYDEDSDQYNGEAINDIGERWGIGRESWSNSELCAIIVIKPLGKGQQITKTLTEFTVDENGRMTFHDTLTITNPDLWWPAGYGQQNQSRLAVSINFENTRNGHDNMRTELHRVEKLIGYRKSELVQAEDQHGRSFYFRINNTDIFCGGSCWIPADSFLTNVSKQRYRDWLQLMIPANQRMIRVWGGGVYEDDHFYEVCDELGILVWQDFMFACGNYPTFPAMLNSVRREAEANIRRLRHHACIVVFAGNNEDYQIREQANLTYDYGDKDPDHWLKTDFPARYIYEHLLPEVMHTECPWIVYHPGSPWGDGKPTSDPTVGDLHQWNVWHGTQEKYQTFDSLGGRFNSEFGMEAFPHLETITSFVEDDQDLYPQSQVIDFHNKAAGHERRIATYLVENVRTATDLAAYIHLSQLIQCEALMFAYRGWRKQWGDDRKCGGALVWQLNDCWPVTSWSICDYYLRRKPAYYSMARVLAPIAVGIQREHYDWSISHAHQPKTQKWQVWAVTSHLQREHSNEIVADIEVRFISVRTGRDIKSATRRRRVPLTPNGTTNLFDGIIDNVSEEPHVLAARLWIDGKIVSRDTDWPQPLKYLHFPDRELVVEFDPSHSQIYIQVARPVKCLVFEERTGCHLSDSAIDVVPGDDQVIHVKGVKDSDPPLSWTYLAAGEQ